MEKLKLTEEFSKIISNYPDIQQTNKTAVFIMWQGQVKAISYMALYKGVRLYNELVDKYYEEAD